MLWKVLSEFPGEDQSAPPLRFGDITDLVIIRVLLNMWFRRYKFYEVQQKGVGRVAAL